MRNPITNILLTTVVIVAVMLMTAITPAAAGKVPDGSSGGDDESMGNTVFIIAGGAVIAGVTIWMITKGNGEQGEDQGDEDSEAGASESHDPENNLLANNEFATESRPVIESEKKLPVSPFIGVSRDETLTVGLSFSF